MKKEIYNLLVEIVSESNRLALENKKLDSLTSTEISHSRLSKLASSKGYSLNDLLELVSNEVNNLSEDNMDSLESSNIMLSYEILQFYA